MSEKPDLFVGIDVCKQELDVYVRPLGERFKLDNDSKGHGELVERLRARPIVRIVLEATGGYEHRVAWTLRQADLPFATRRKWSTCACEKWSRVKTASSAP